LSPVPSTPKRCSTMTAARQRDGGHSTGHLRCSAPRQSLTRGTAWTSASPAATGSPRSPSCRARAGAPSTRRAAERREADGGRQPRPASATARHQDRGPHRGCRLEAHQKGAAGPQEADIGEHRRACRRNYWGPEHVLSGTADLGDPAAREEHVDGHRLAVAGAVIGLAPPAQAMAAATPRPRSTSSPRVSTGACRCRRMPIPRPRCTTA
jgi:hypothetical protein